MIKIIEHGKIKNFTTTCSHCGCVFSYEENDIKNRTTYTLTNTTEIIETINCPECYYEIVLSHKSQPWSYPYPWITTPYISPENPYGGPIVTYCCEDKGKKKDE